MHNLKRYCLRQPDGLFQLCVGGSAEIMPRRPGLPTPDEVQLPAVAGGYGLEETVLLPIDLVSINVPTFFVAGLR